MALGVESPCCANGDGGVGLIFRMFGMDDGLVIYVMISNLTDIFSLIVVWQGLEAGWSPITLSLCLYYGGISQLMNERATKEHDFKLIA